jgi:hypothetical protein
MAIILQAPLVSCWHQRGAFGNPIFGRDFHPAHLGTSRHKLSMQECSVRSSLRSCILRIEWELWGKNSHRNGSPVIYGVFIRFWPTLYICAFPAKNTVYKLYIYGSCQPYIYTEYIRYCWQGSHWIYGHIWCICVFTQCWPTLLVNPGHFLQRTGGGGEQRKQGLIQVIGLGFWTCNWDTCTCNIHAHACTHTLTHTCTHL